MQLTDYDPVDLAEKAGAVQLLPENADFYIEMLRCSALVAALPSAGQGLFRVPDHTWRLWINSTEPMANAPEFGGDPHEGLFVAEVPCFGGGYLTIPADGPGDPFIVECLLEAALLRLDGEKRQFELEIAEIALAGLWISDRCVRRAGLNRHTEPTMTDNGEIRWPGGSAAQELQAAVNFSRDDIAESLSTIGVGDGGISKLGFQQGDVASDYTGYLANPLRRRPLLLAGDSVIVISPMTLLIAVRDAILEAARSFSIESKLIDAYRGAVQSRVEDYADLLQWERLDGAAIEIAGTKVAESYYRFDSDKVAAIFTVCDDLQNGSIALEDRHWNLKSTIEGIESRAKTVQQQFFDLEDPPYEILSLIVVQGVGRSYILGFGKVDDKRAVRVALTADEFRVFTLLNLNDELALWHVARARDQLPSTTGMLYGGFLDHYAHFRNRRKSYYFGDEGIPDLVYYTASGVHSRLEAQSKLDPHFVRRPHNGKYGMVVRLESRPNFPIYTTPDSSDSIQLLVEGLSFRVWVIARETSYAQLQDYRLLFFHLVDVIAFWIWQTTPSIQSLASRSQIRVDEIVIEVELARPDEWLTLIPNKDEFGIMAKCADDCRIRFTFGPEFAAQSSLPDNAAERQLTRVLFQHLCSLFDVSIDSADLDAIINEHIPAGVKRRISVMQGATQEIVNTDGLPRVRKVQSFDEQIISDLLGAHLRDSENYNIGEISDESRSKLCHASVRFLYAHFQSLVAELSDTELLQHLIARHESLIADRRLLDVIMATHLACFGQSDETMWEFQNDVMATDRTSVASRFLIEYVAATPPNGSHKLSMSAYDRLIAIASEITYYGQVSDSLYYQLSQHSFELLKSGRLALSAPQYEQAIADAQAVFYRRMSESSVKEYREAMEPSSNNSGDPMQPEIIELEHAMSAEFGLSLSQLGAILGTIANSPFTSDSGIGQCDSSELVAYIAAEVSLDETIVASALVMFTLGARPDFLRPEKPFGPADVYPWRFNRGLSYLRKPLVATGSDLLWGRRAVRQAASYLFTLCTRGRLKNTKTQEMRRYQGNISNRLGDAFNERVAKLLDDSGRFVVRQRVKKLNGLRLARDNGEDLGDVDVLAAEPSTRRILSIEAKCFSLAKTPAELANEREQLFGDLENRTGAIGRHMDRTEWLRIHRNDVLKELRIDSSSSESWSVTPFLVVDSDLVSPRLVTPPLSVVAIADMLNEL